MSQICLLLLLMLLLLCDPWLLTAGRTQHSGVCSWCESGKEFFFGGKQIASSSTGLTKCWTVGMWHVLDFTQRLTIIFLVSHTERHNFSPFRFVATFWEQHVHTTTVLPYSSLSFVSLSLDSLSFLRLSRCSSSDGSSLVLINKFWWWGWSCRWWW